MIKQINKNAEEICINYVLGQFAKGKQEAGKIGEIYNIIKREDGFLSELKVENKEQLSSSLRERIDLSCSGESKNVLGSIKENLEANYKQGIVAEEKLKDTLVSFGSDIKGLDNSLQEITKAGRNKYLGAFALELTELDKFGYKYDKDELVGAVKSMSYKQSEEYINKILVQSAKQYIEPILKKHESERHEAFKKNDYGQFLQVIGKEQEAHKDLHENHRFAVRAIDKVNGNAHLSIITSDASKLSRSVGMEKILSTLDYVVKHNLVKAEKVTDTINREGGDLDRVYREAKSKYEDNQNELSKEALAQEDRNKVQELQREQARTKVREERGWER